MYWPADSYLISNVAREAKRVAHPWSRLIKELSAIWRSFRGFSIKYFNHFQCAFLIFYDWLKR